MKKNGEPANFLDVGGSATEEMVTNAFRILTSDKYWDADHPAGTPLDDIMEFCAWSYGRTFP